MINKQLYLVQEASESPVYYVFDEENNSFVCQKLKLNKLLNRRSKVFCK